MSSLLPLRVIYVRGTPTQLGSSHGAQLADLIPAFVASRLSSATAYLAPFGVGPAAYLAAAAASLETLRTWHADGYQEHVAIALAAGVDAVELFAAGNMTDLRDVAMLTPAVGDAEGCTTIAALCYPVAGAARQCVAGRGVRRVALMCGGLVTKLGG